jgi:hypothetical protein
MNKLLDGLFWKPLPMPAQNKDNLPYATHEGILKIGDFEFHVSQLNTGERVLLEDEIRDFFGLASQKEKEYGRVKV